MSRSYTMRGFAEYKVLQKRQEKEITGAAVPSRLALLLRVPGMLLRVPHALSGHARTRRLNESDGLAHIAV